MKNKMEYSLLVSTHIHIDHKVFDFVAKQKLLSSENKTKILGRTDRLLVAYMFIWYYKGRLFWFYYSNFQVVGGEARRHVDNEMISYA
jgi:hypothetical protein